MYIYCIINSCERNFSPSAFSNLLLSPIESDLYEVDQDTLSSSAS